MLQGEIGQYIITARKSGDEWFVGAITNNQEREVSIPMDFLPKGKKFLVSVYSDDSAQSTRTKVKIERRSVRSIDVAKMKLEASGGVALWLRPESVKEKSKEPAKK